MHTASCLSLILIGIFLLFDLGGFTAFLTEPGVRPSNLPFQAKLTIPIAHAPRATDSTAERSFSTTCDASTFFYDDLHTIDVTCENNRDDGTETANTYDLDQCVAFGGDEDALVCGPRAVGE